MAEIIDSIVVRVVADVDEAQRKVVAYGEAAEEAFTRAQKATDVGDARLAHSMAGRRAAYRELGQQISQITTEAINGGNAFVLLGQHGIETAATLEKFGGTVGRIGSILSGPLGVAVQLAVSVLGQLAGKLLENDQNADAAAAAMGRFQQQQSDIGRFIDLTTGKIKEQNRTLVRNGILTTQGEIDQRNKEAKFKRDEAFDAVRALAEPSTHGTFLQRLGPFATGFYTYDRELQAILRKAGGDIVKLDGLLAELKKKRPSLGAVATQVSNAAGLQIDAAQKNAKDELLIRALGGDDAALAELVRALRGSRPNSPAPVGSTVASVVSQRSITSAVASPSGHSPELSPTELRAGAADALEDIEAAIRVTVVPQPSLREIEEAVLEAVAAASPIDLDAFTIIDTEQLEKVAKISAMLSDDLAKGLTNAIISGKSLGDVLVDSFARAGQALIQSKIVQLLDPNGDGAAGFVGTANKVFGTIFAAPRPPRRASGGHVSAGQLYRVNEAGIEGFRPAGSGTIVPLGRMAAARPGGGVTVMQPLNVSFAGAITTPELMAEFKAYADGVGQAAAIGGAAMAQSRMARRAARTLPR